MEKESIPVALEDKYVQRFSVKWILTPRKQFAFRKTNSGVNDSCPSISLHKRQTLTQWNSVDKLKDWLFELSKVSISVLELFELISVAERKVCSRYR